jgi:hypothetical protein
MNFSADVIIPLLAIDVQFELPLASNSASIVFWPWLGLLPRHCIHPPAYFAPSARRRRAMTMSLLPLPLPLPALGNKTTMS